MLPFLLILGIFLFWTLVGQAILAALKVRFGLLWSWLLAPTLGLSLTVLLVTTGSKWGHPVRAVGPWVTGLMAAGAAAVLVWRRPKLPFRQLRPFAAVLVLYLIYAGWPMFRYGFNWISYGNDDMANYTLGAERFLNNSYYFLPEQTELEGRNYSQHLWFMHALQQIRPGSEMLLAWTCSLTGLNPHQVFMPLIFAFGLLQLAGIGALVLHRGRNRELAFYSVALLAISPLFSLGTLYQLIAQVSGIALLFCACALILRTVRFAWNSIAATGLMLAAIGLTYPEVSPLVAMSIVVYAVWLRYVRPADFSEFTHRVVAMAVLTFVFLGTSTYEFLNTLILQSLGSAGLGAMADISQLDGLVLFPWTLVPSFLPMIFGLHAFGIVGADPMLSIVIAIGLVMLLAVGVRAVLSLLKGDPPAVLAAIMIPLGIYLFAKGQDFGLFKLGMFSQGVIAFFLAWGLRWVAGRWGRRLAAAVFIVYLAATFPSANYYVRSSLGTVGGGLSEVIGASARGVAFHRPQDVPYDAIESDITNVVSAKMLAMYTQGTDTRFLSRNYMDNVANIAPLKFLRNPDPEFGDRRSQMLRPLQYIRWMLPDELLKDNVAEYNAMPMTSIDNSWSETSFRHLDYQHPLFVALDSQYDHFNKFPTLIGDAAGWHHQGLYIYKPLDEVQNRLIFIHSEKGPHYYSSARFRAAFFQREPEPISGYKRYFHGTGRYSWFQILNPTPKIRMMIDFTRTSLGGDRSPLPTNAVVQGDVDYPIPFVGSGSARVFTGLIQPQVFEGLSYVGVDFGEEAKTIPKSKTGLMLLWGKAFNLDDRKLVGFTRDISIVTEDEYEHLQRPSRISKLPDDLYNYPGLEYSGLFEDGWLADRSYVCLAPSKKGDVFTFRGEVPNLAEFRQGLGLTLTIDGQPTEPIVLHPGPFTLNRFIPQDSNVTRVGITFTKAQVYGANDARRVSAFLYECSVRPTDDLLAFNRSLDRPPGDSFQIHGLWPDGWAGREVGFRLPPTDRPRNLDLRLEFPSWAPVGARQLVVEMDGATVFTQAVKQGTYQDLSIPLAGVGEKSIVIRADGDFALPGQDRRCAYRVIQMQFRDPLARAAAAGARYQLNGADRDGWAGHDLSLAVPAATGASAAEIEIEFPGWASVRSGHFTFSVDGKEFYAADLSSNTYKTVRLPLAPGRDHEIEVRSDEDFALPAPDGRRRSFRIVKLDVR
jgi:hypothetical protein